MKNKRISTLFMLLMLGMSTIWISSCDNDVPEEENEEEIITDVTLNFTSAGETVTVTAQDPDGEGPQSIAVSGPINLTADTEYVLTLDLQNAVEGESITEEVEEEADEHMFFFSFTNGLFSNPEGDGNIDSRSDAVNYNDADGSGQPLGLSTTWTTGGAASGSFRLILKHQPELKTATSGSDVGSTDLDLTWDLVIE